MEGLKWKDDLTTKGKKNIFMKRKYIQDGRDSKLHMKYQAGIEVKN